MKNTKRKNTRKNLAGVRKRKFEELDNSKKFQTIINSVSADGIYMPEFYKFLYKKKNNNIFNQDLTIYRDVRDYRKDKNSNSTTCIYYKKGHWYAVVNGITYDAYKSKIQLPGTNSFCQSYAIYLAAYNGIIDNDFKKLEYADNIQQMACLHCEFIDTIDKIYYKDYYEDFEESFHDINEDEKEENKLKPVSLDTLKSYLQKICDNNHLAHEFAVSKEDGL